MTLKDFEDEPSSQLQSDLQDSIPSAHLRPLLTHLNADTSWLVSLPYPADRPSLKKKAYFHILLDPWFTGPQSDVAAFFSRQWHAIPSAVQTAEEFEEVVANIEADVNGGTYRANKSNGGNESLVDIIVISHEFTDHMHQETLLSLARSIPIIASPKAFSIIQSWKHFTTAVELPRFNGNWRMHSPHLPDWISVSKVAYPGKDLLYYHSAVLLAFSKPGSLEDADSILYTPHGISPANLTPIVEAKPNIHTLALLHGLQDIRLGAQLNMGAHNGLKVLRALGARYWVGTHDEVKKGGGIVSWFLKRDMINVKDAVEKERNETGKDIEGLEGVRFEEVGNGEALVLE